MLHHISDFYGARIKYFSIDIWKKENNFFDQFLNLYKKF